jgi:hippurate hydrolase
MIQKLLEKLLPEIIQARQTLHACPELKYEEQETAKLVAEYLKRWGYEVTESLAKTGISAVLDSGKPGKTVALRADMDALPILEQTGLTYASKNSGKMHACGHDGHTATLLAVAGTLIHCRELFKGKIKFIFQPAEEGGGGAAEMIKAGVLENPKVDAIFGYHNMPLPLGKVAVKSDCIFAGADFLTIKIHGKGAHAAFPEKSINPIWIGSRIVQALQSVVSHEIPAVLSVTEFHAGNTFNVIPEDARLTISLRTTSPEVRAQALQQCQNITDEIAKSIGASVEIETIYACPPTMNTVAESELVMHTAQTLYGKSNVIAMKHPAMVTEDFAFYLEKIPGCFFLVGNGEVNSALHTPFYNFQDSVIPIAANVLINSAINYLNQNTLSY